MSRIAEIIAVGTELLLGQIINTNAQFLSRELAELGIDVYHQSVVGDNIKRISHAVRVGLGRADIVILCGGLGPTEDDCTREGVADALQKPLVQDEGALSMLLSNFAGREMPESNLRQAMVPRGARVLKNPRGTAPGLALMDRDKLILLLPGPPRELNLMFREEVVPVLLEHGFADGRLFSRTLHLAGAGESAVADQLRDLIIQQTNPTVALYSRLGEVDIRLTTRAMSQTEAGELLRPLETEILLRLGEHVFGYDEDTLASVAGRRLAQAGLSLATAESCTGGMLSTMITAVPGSSTYYRGSIIAYDNSIKKSLLKVSSDTLKAFGAVSIQCAEEMLRGVLSATGAQVGVAVTGIAGPGGGTAEKPVGTVCLAVGSLSRFESCRVHMRGEREAVRERAAKESLRRLIRWLKEETP